MPNWPPIETMYRCLKCGKAIRWGSSHCCCVKEIGAGGEQAGRIDHAEASPSVRPVDAPGPPSASDLYRWFCSPWCPKCGFCDNPIQHHDCEQCDKCENVLQIGLHTKVEGLEYHSEKTKKHWTLKGTQPYVSHLQITDTHAASLLEAGAEKSAMQLGYGIHKHRLHDGICRATLVKDDKWISAEAPTLPEAVAIAYQRMLDAEEQP